MYYLDTFLNYENNLKNLSRRNLHLQRVRLVLTALGSPQKNLKVLHIAGSKGKGSTAAFTANILRAAGYRVGLYTSPHIENVRERFRILKPKKNLNKSTQKEIFDDCISKEKLFRLIKKIRPQLELGRHHAKFGNLTYFEVLTIAAFYYFREENVDFVVLETGLGGRLDATNVCQSLVSAITPISLEHTQQLGKTLGEIAYEKAGIIKKDSMVLLAPQKAQALKVIKEHCLRLGVKPILVKKNPYKISLLGLHQNVNAAVAVGMINCLRAQGFSISEYAVKKGLAKTLWPLRFEIISRKPHIVLDAAHNPQSCQCLIQTVKKVFPKKKAILIFGVSDDKDIAGMAKILSANSELIILTQASHPRAFIWTSQNVRKYFPKQNLVMADSLLIACKFAQKLASHNDLILVAGSIFVTAQARKIFKKSL